MTAFVASGSRLVTDEMFLTAAYTLASHVRDEDLKVGRVYPPLTEIREVSAAIAVATAEIAYKTGLAACQPKPADLREHIESLMYEPAYETFA